MIRNLSTAPHYTWGGVCDGWRLVDRDDLSVIRERVPPGAGEVLHRHRQARQAFVMLAGGLEIDIDGVTATLAEGDSLEIEPGRPHRVRNAGTVDAWFLVVSTPSTRNNRENLEP